MGNPLMNALLTGRAVTQLTQIQPQQASVEKTKYKGRAFVPWSAAAAAIHATTDMLSVPVWGSTKPTDFITISGAQPHAPVVIEVPSILGSNAPVGGGK